MTEPALSSGRAIVRPRPSRTSAFLAREYGLPALLFAASVVTTMAIGARFMRNFLDRLPAVASERDLWPWPWLIEHPQNFALGWPFSVALLGIVLAHEFGHYFACRAHRIRVTLPWVLPAPTLSGTAGAIIRVRSRIPGRRALIDIGIYGPLAGYAASLVAIAVGFALSRPAVTRFGAGHQSALVTFGEPLTLRLVHRVVGVLVPDSPAFGAALHHPVLIAGWVGLFLTSLNLIPGGQLDGGHILYAISPRLHRATTFVLPVALICCGVFFWIGWILWGLLLFIPAMRHPRVPAEEPLNRGRLLLGVVAVLLFALTFAVAPFAGGSLIHYFL